MCRNDGQSTGDFHMRSFRDGKRQNMQTGTSNRRAADRTVSSTTRIKIKTGVSSDTGCVELCFCLLVSQSVCSMKMSRGQKKKRMQKTLVSDAAES